MTVDLKLVEVDTKTLSGDALDWAVSIVKEGKVLVYPEGGFYPPEGSISLNEDTWCLYLNDGEGDCSSWMPSADWLQAWPLIRQYLSGEALIVGEDTLAIAMRAIVREVLGETVSVPAAMLEEADS